ncbi:hypothetical protein K3495_g6220 [Podosphaera aphanis]|nr:hypothetical protein K3495_g6220 [Podosphaera aphanis]
MSCRVPGNLDTDDKGSLYSTESIAMSRDQDQMDLEQQSGSSNPQEQLGHTQQQSELNTLANLPPELFKAISEKFAKEILSQFQNPSHPPPPPIQPIPPSVNLQKQASKWPTWDGNYSSYSAHIFSLRVKIEEDSLLLGSNRLICFNIFNSIPIERQPRISHWYQTGGPNGSHDRQAFLAFITEQYEDK